MSDLEQNLKQAVQNAKTLGESRPAGSSAATIFEMLTTIRSRMDETIGRAVELSDLLAGPSPMNQTHVPETIVPVSVFDRLGREILELGRQVERLERELSRGLATLR